MCVNSTDPGQNCSNGEFQNTVQFLNLRTPENFAVMYLKFKQRGQTFGYFVQKCMWNIANNEDPDQTAPLGAV